MQQTMRARLCQQLHPRTRQKNIQARNLVGADDIERTRRIIRHNALSQQLTTPSIKQNSQRGTIRTRRKRRSRNEMNRTDAVNRHAPRKPQRPRRSYANTDTGKTARANIDDNRRGLALAGQRRHRWHYRFCMSPADQAMLMGNQPCIFKQRYR